MGEPFDFVAVVQARAARFSVLARRTPHDVRLPHLRRWTVHDVVAHLAGDHRWAEQILRTRRAPRSGLSKARQRGGALCDHFDEITASLLEALRTAAAEPDAPCPNFAQGAAGRAGWWPRHQAHEAAVHLWDLEAAAGDHSPLDPGLSADGIDELFEVYTNRYDGQALDRALVLRAPDVDRSWRATPTDTPGRVRVAPSRAARGDVEAPADVLLLALWHRVPVDHPAIAVHRHHASARAFVGGPLTA